MKTKMHLGVFIIFLAFLGTYLESRTVPNQQIVIEFSDQDIAKEDAESAIEIVKNQLQRLGVAHIQIGQNDKGQLKITYFSNSDVSRIQSILSKEEGFKFSYQSDENNSTNYPEGKNVKDYELNISEIHNSNDTNWDFERTEVVGFNLESDQSYTSKVNSSGEQTNVEQSNRVITVAIQVNNAVALATDNLSYKIPEVRAGPSVNGMI